jgi:hypothetical protein
LASIFVKTLAPLRSFFSLKGLEMKNTMVMKLVADSIDCRTKPGIFESLPEKRAVMVAVVLADFKIYEERFKEDLIQGLKHLNASERKLCARAQTIFMNQLVATHPQRQPNAHASQILSDAADYIFSAIN